MTGDGHSLASWEGFYVIVGSSGAALIGLQFVVITLIAEMRPRVGVGSVAAFGAGNARAGILTRPSCSVPTLRGRPESKLRETRPSLGTGITVSRRPSMNHPDVRRRALEIILLLAALSSAALFMVPAQVLARTNVPVGPFRSVTLRNGGEVILRHGPEHRVTLIEGSTEYTQARILDGDRLEIDRGGARCPEGYEMVVEVLTPDVDDLFVADGGTIETHGDFPRKARVRVAVASGGTIDVRSMNVESVLATVEEGGRILTKPEKNLVASVVQGGAITYWGKPNVTSSVEQGGVVVRGKAADANRPLRVIADGTGDVPAIPPVPAIPAKPTRVRRTS